MLDYAWHYGPPPPGVPDRAALRRGGGGWPPGVYWTLSVRHGGVVILDRYRLPDELHWRRAPGKGIEDLRYEPPRRRAPGAGARNIEYPDYDGLCMLACREIEAVREWFQRETLLNEWVDAHLALREAFLREAAHLPRTADSDDDESEDGVASLLAALTPPHSPRACTPPPGDEDDDDHDTRCIFTFRPGATAPRPPPPPPRPPTPSPERPASPVRPRELSFPMLPPPPAADAAAARFGFGTEEAGAETEDVGGGFRWCLQAPPAGASAAPPPGAATFCFAHPDAERRGRACPAVAPGPEEWPEPSVWWPSAWEWDESLNDMVWLGPKDLENPLGSMEPPPMPPRPARGALPH